MKAATCGPPRSRLVARRRDRGGPQEKVSGGTPSGEVSRVGGWGGTSYRRRGSSLPGGIYDDMATPPRTITPHYVIWHRQRAINIIVRYRGVGRTDVVAVVLMSKIRRCKMLME